ncbi:MAG TPA: hypothetical protein VMF14_06280 [Solirubrobacteraceae bacterium]|nr:hypothetical protein [Solirubrobacteraceae bacterium]
MTFDPIHPLLPTTAPGLTPIAPAPAIAPTDRRVERQRQQEERERRRRQQQRRDSYNGDESYSADDDAGDDDGRLHVDVTA